MGTVAIIAVVTCVALWIAAVVEFSRTLSELARCRLLANRALNAISAGQ